MRFLPQQWHSGWDGQRLAEVMPASPQGWFVTVLGQGRAAIWLRPLPEEWVLSRCEAAGFGVAQATWRSHPTPSFVENPFAVKGPLPQALILAQRGTPGLPVAPEDNVPIWVGPAAPAIVRPPSQVYVLQAAAANLLRLGVSRDPVTSWRAAQKTSPHELVLWGAFPGTARTLKRLTTDFAELALGNGWFRGDRPLLDYLAAQLG
ncbi:MAG: hypothetical protein ACUVSQ_06515 [Pseudanabaenaceae cyanobacterium]